MELTIKEKMKLTTGKGMWHTQDLNGKLESIQVSDGPYGLRKQSEDAKTNNDSILATCFPTPSAMAASWDTELVAKVAEAIAKEAYNENVSVLLGPGINMKRSPLCGRNFEYFSEDPYLAGKLGIEYVKAVEDLGVGTSLKHFAANSQETLRMTSNSMVDEKALREIYLNAFEMVVKEAKPATIMASYNKLNGLYATENKWLLTDVLRNEWKYKGLVVSDWGACLRLPNALKAGMDLEMPDSHGYHLKKLAKAYKKGLITEEEINVPANRVLNLVSKYSVKNRTEKKNVSKNHELAVEAACESAVLLENLELLPLNHTSLPLDTSKITIVGGLARNVRFQGGGSSHINTNKVMDAIEAFTKAGYQVKYLEGYSTLNANVDEKLELEAVNSIEADELVLFFGGLPEFAEGEGYDRKTLEMPKNQLELLDKISKKTFNIGVITFGGAPFNLMPLKNKVRSILHMYLGGEGVMEAVERIVSGKVCPSGKLAETFPLSIEDTPAYKEFATGSKDIKYKESIFIGYRYYDTYNVPVLYPFGYGLSYSSFEYNDLEVTENESSLTVKFDIKNTGNYKAKEIAQIYVGRTGKYLHAKKELKGFIKVEIDPTSTKTVAIDIPLESLKIYDTEMGWILPKEELNIFVGKSSADIALSTRARVDGEEYSSFYPSVYDDIDNKLKNISDDDFKVLYNNEFSTFDNVKKGSFTIENSLKELSKHSLKAKLILRIAKNVMYKEFKNKPKDDPEVMMVIETIEGGSIDCVFCQGGLPYRLAESIVLSANGHRFKALHKLIWG